MRDKITKIAVTTAQGRAVEITGKDLRTIVADYGIILITDERESRPGEGVSYEPYRETIAIFTTPDKVLMGSET